LTANDKVTIQTGPLFHSNHTNTVLKTMLCTDVT